MVSELRIPKMLTIINVLLLIDYCVIAKICNVLDYGAKGDGVTDDTKSLQLAIDECTSTTSSLINTILLPSNYKFLSYPLVIENSNTELLIDENSTLIANPDNYSWPQDQYHQYQHFITSKHKIENITITGKGLINGMGQYWWHPDNITFNRPYLILINETKNLNISYLTLLNSPMFHIFIGNDENVVIHDITIQSPNYTIAPNTDGIDCASKNVHIYNCHITNGDDSYSIWSGSQNVLIENSYSGFGLGLDSWDGGQNNTGGSGGNMNNITFKNIYLNRTGWGIRLRTYSYFNGSTNNFKFINITMDNVRNAIDINQFNQSVDHKNDDKLKWTDFNNISFIDIHGSYTNWAGHLDCSSDDPCYGLYFDNINLKSINGNSEGFSCSDNVYGKAVNVSPPLTCLNA